MVGGHKPMKTALSKSLFTRKKYSETKITTTAIERIASSNIENFLNMLHSFLEIKKIKFKVSE